MSRADVETHRAEVFCGQFAALRFDNRCHRRRFLGNVHVEHLQVIQADMRAVRRDDTLTPDQKREKLDGLIAERNGYLKRVVEESRAATQPVNQ